MGAREVSPYCANRSQFQQSNFESPEPQVWPHDLVIRTMKDLGFPPKMGVLDVALIGPIPLFPSTVAKRMREELLDERVMKACLVEGQIAQKEIVGAVPR